MDVRFTDSFSKSLKRLIWHQHPIYKVWEFFRYKFPHFIKNVWLFRKELYRHRWWDYSFNLEMLYRSILITHQGMSTKGWEVSETRDPKVKAMARALELMKNKMDDNYIDRAELELGSMATSDFGFTDAGNELYQLIDTRTEEEKQHCRKVYNRASEIEEQEWKELWEIFKGTENSKKVGESYDGTDMRSWWD